MGSSYKLWDKRLRESDTLTRGQIRQFCNAIASGSYGFEIRGHRTNLTPTECAYLMDTFYERKNGYKLIPEHTRFGLEWLKTDPKRALKCGVTDRMIETFKEFRFVGVRVGQISPLGHHAHMLPIYRVISDEPYVDYSWSPWQREAYA